MGTRRQDDPLLSNVYIPTRPVRVSTAPFDDWCAGYDPVSDNQLRQTGLRGTRLCVVIACISVLWILALTTLLCNIWLMVTLGISPRGMHTMQFYSETNNKGEKEHVVRFTGDDTNLGTIVSKAGVVRGRKDNTLMLAGSRVLLRSNLTNRPERIEMILGSGRIRLNNVENFMTVNSKTDRPMFSAKHPQFKLNKGIKKISTAQVITNKVRSPTNSSLKFDVENLSFRGNEGNTFTSRNLKIQALNNIEMRTVKTGNGALRFDGAGGFFLNEARKFQLSSSPSLNARELGFRLCACLNSKRIFAVPGHQPCKMPDGYCY